MARTELDKAAIINMCLVTQIGMPPSYSIDSEDQMGSTCDFAWDQAVGEIFGNFDWFFARKLFKLVRQADAPDNGWSYGFDMPANGIGAPIAVLDQAGEREHKLRSFLLEGDGLYANVDAVWARFRVVPDPAYWDIAFVSNFTILLGSYLAHPLSQDPELRQTLRTMALGTPSQGGTGGVIGRYNAVVMGSQQPAQHFGDDNPLIAARNGGW